MLKVILLQWLLCRKVDCKKYASYMYATDAFKQLHQHYLKIPESKKNVSNFADNKKFY